MLVNSNVIHLLPINYLEKANDLKVSNGTKYLFLLSPHIPIIAACTIMLTGTVKST